MRMGIAYDSADGAAICGALTAIMTGEAYAVSARIAAQKGPFDRYAQNRGSMLRVIEKHCAKVAEIGERCPPELRQAAGESWNEALALGRAHGYRNAQATVLAPTGTIGLLMDCDTTGIEPDFALVKFKKLAGGGYFKIVNSSVPPALRRLGYSNEAIEDILRYAVGRLSFHGSPHIHRDSLLERGLTEEEIDRAQGALRSAFDLSGAFAPHVIGREAYVRLGLDPKTAQAGDLLVRIGFGPEQIQEADEDICGRMTLEGAPGLKPEHQAVFDCANRCGRGTRVISPMGHLSMMAAAQPFISGAISKTVNLPSETTVEEIRNLYVTGWQMGLKAVAIYRDGSKASQPLSSSKTKKKGKEEREASAAEESAAASAEARLAAVAAESSEPQKARRRRLPKRRGGFTQEARVGGHKVFLRTGEYEDGTLGEIFIDMHKEGAAFRSMMNCFAIAVSKGLQYGVPLEEFVETFTFTRFEPQGMVDHPNIRMATSVIDYVFRVLGLEYLGRTDFCQIKPEDTGDEDDKDAVEESFELYTGQQTPRRPVSNGNGSRANGREAARTERVGARAQAASAAAASQAALNRHMESFMGDAPFCDVCGNITMRNGSCYRCQNCGNSMGCS
ncbi:MAG: Vitamin B12-dependent ribonucleotide reductase [candidate division BRC1 bacterium ADurb.BinA364]|nr:MAG: Vitamin B12-dependent ribonucleotide reductase [candidate division BRC1 bacterium ADurb.BinA364]